LLSDFYGLNGRNGFAALKQIVTAIIKVNSKIIATVQYIIVLEGSNTVVTSSSNVFFPFIDLSVKVGVIIIPAVALASSASFGLVFSL
jgi:hypothetical protein